MKERPILFKGAMVRAILAGTKTQTRRIVNVERLHRTPLSTAIDACPYGVPGDELWVREAWRRVDEACDGRLGPIAYRATDDGAGGPWKPSIHMPRWASRIQLRVTAVRIERLRKITAEDVAAEGVIAPDPRYGVVDFAVLWDSINDKRAPWGSNPWVWVVEFERKGVSC